MVLEPPGSPQLDLGGDGGVLEVAQHRGKYHIVGVIEREEDGFGQLPSLLQFVHQTGDLLSQRMIRNRVKPGRLSQFVYSSCVAGAHRVHVELHGPAAPVVLPAQPQQELRLEALDLAGCESLSLQGFPADPVGFSRPDGEEEHGLGAVVAGYAARTGELVHADIQSLEQGVPIPDLHTGSLREDRNIVPPGALFNAQGVVRPVGGDDLGVQQLLLCDPVVIFQGVSGILGGTERIYIGALDEMLGRVGAVCQHGAGLLPDGGGAGGIQDLGDAEISLQLQVGPVVQRIADGEGDRLGVSQEFVIIVSVSGDPLLGDAVAAHGPPLVVVAVQPELGEIFSGFVFTDLLGAEVAVVVDDGLLFRKVVVEHFRCVIQEHEVLIQKLFHDILPVKNVSG